MFERDFASESAPANMASRGHFRGVWNAASEIVVGTLREVSHVAETRDISELVGRDLAEFNAVVADVYKRNSSASVIFTLHFEAFADGELSKQYMLALRQPPARLLPFVTPRLVGIDADVPPRLLEKRLYQLQSLFRKVIIETRGADDVGRFAQLRHATLAATWDAISGSGDAARTARQFQTLVKDCGLSSMMTGVDCDLSFDVATGAGFDMVAGGRIGCFERPLAAQYALSRALIADGA